MNFAVCVKQVPDSETYPKIDQTGKGIQLEKIKWIMNPYDEYAIEEALQLSEKYGGEVTIVSLGSNEIEPTMRSALAMGAKKAIRINASHTPTDPLVTAKALAKILKEGNYDLILFGKQAIDDDNAQIPQMVGEALQLPCATSVTKLNLVGTKCIANREIEGGNETVSFNLPGIISAHKGLNEPRYPSLKGIMMAKKITIEIRETQLEEEKILLQRLVYPPQKEAGKIFKNGAIAIPELITLLHEKLKVI